MASIYIVARIQQSSNEVSESTFGFFSTLRSANHAARKLVQKSLNTKGASEIAAHATIRGEHDRSGCYKTEWEEIGREGSRQVEVCVVRKKLDGPDLSKGEVDSESENDGGWSSEEDHEEGDARELERVSDLGDLGDVESDLDYTSTDDEDGVEALEVMRSERFNGSPDTL